MNDLFLAKLADSSRLIRRAFDARARAIGVTRPQWQVLSALRRHPGINQGALAEMLDVDPITVCRMVDRLQDASLVERRSDPADRRAWRLHLLPKADEIVVQLRPLADALQADALEGVETDELAALTALLDRVNANLARKIAAPEPTPEAAHG
jgi:DNA-binding MarR family transcriptional regulator